MFFWCERCGLETQQNLTQVKRCVLVRVANTLFCHPLSIMAEIVQYRISSSNPQLMFDPYENIGDEFERIGQTLQLEEP
jgi:hypothetical protein